METNLEISALVTQAREQYHQGDFLSAAAAYARAGDVYTSQGDALMAAEMKNDQCVSLLRGGFLQEALDSVNGTEDVFTAVQDFRRMGVAAANRGSVLEAMKHTPEAVDAYTLSAEYLQTAGEDQMRLQVMQLLSAIHLKRGKFLNAVMALQSGLVGVSNPTKKQKLMKKLLFIRI